MSTASALGRVIRPADVQPLNILGTPTATLLRRTDTGGAFSLFEIGAPKGLGVPNHIHTHEDETFRVIAGTIRFVVEGREILAGPGVTLHSPRGQRHAWFGASDEQARMLVIANPSGMEEMFVELGRLPAGPPDMAQVTGICARYGITFTG